MSILKLPTVSATLVKLVSLHRSITGLEKTKHSKDWRWEDIDIKEVMEIVECLKPTSCDDYDYFDKVVVHVLLRQYKTDGEMNTDNKKLIVAYVCRLSGNAKALKIKVEWVLKQLCDFQFKKQRKIVKKFISQTFQVHNVLLPYNNKSDADFNDDVEKFV